MTTPTVDSGGLTITLGDLILAAAASRISGGATSLSLRNHANNADNLLLTDAGNATLRGLLTNYNGLALAGTGVPIIVAFNHLSGQTAQVASLATFTPSADGAFEVCIDILVTTAGTSVSFTTTCTYTDEGGSSRVATMSFLLLAGTPFATTILTATGAVPYTGVPKQIRAKSGSAITLATTATNFGSPTVVYDITGVIKQLG
jgi:hypothetical protein